VDVFRGEGGKAGKADRGGRIAAGVEEEVMSCTFFVKYVTKSSAVGEGGGGEGELRREDNMEQQFPCPESRTRQ